MQTAPTSLPTSAPIALMPADLATTVHFSNSLDSADLLQGQKAVSIIHNGTAYRLQATKLGKLILTK